MARLKPLADTLPLAEAVLLHGTPMDAIHTRTIHGHLTTPLAYQGFILGLALDGLYLAWSDRRCKNGVQQARVFAYNLNPLPGLTQMAGMEGTIPTRAIYENTDRQWAVFVAFLSRNNAPVQVYVPGEIGSHMWLNIGLRVDGLRTTTSYLDAYRVPNFFAMGAIPLVRRKIHAHMERRAGITPAISAQVRMPDDGTLPGSLTLSHMCDQLWITRRQWWGEVAREEREERIAAFQRAERAAAGLEAEQARVQAALGPTPTPTPAPLPNPTPDTPLADGSYTVTVERVEQHMDGSFTTVLNNGYSHRSAAPRAPMMRPGRFRRSGR